MDEPIEKKKRPVTEAMKMATQKYDAKNTRNYHLKLNLTHDANIIRQLEKQKSMQGYIKHLIRKDIGDE